METLIYIGVLLAVTFITIIAIYFTRKYNITKQELEFVTILLELVEYVTKQFKFEQQHNITKIMEYVIDAAQLTQELIDVNKEDYGQIKVIIFDKAKEICLNNGLEMDAELEAMIDSAVTFVIENYII